MGALLARLHGGLVAFLRGDGSDGRSGAETVEIYASAAVVFILRVAGALAAYATQVYLARLLGATEYGIFALIWVWSTVAGHLAPLGFSQTVCRFAPHYLALDQRGLLKGFLGTGAAFVLLSATAMALLGIVALSLARRSIDPVYLGPALAALLILPAFSLQEYLENVARAFNWPVVAILPPYLIRHSLLGLFMFAVAMAGFALDASSAMLAALAATLSAVAVQLVITAPRLVSLLGDAESSHERHAWFRTAWPLLFVDGTHVVLSNIDVLILGFFATGPELAVYFAATRLQQLVAFVSYAVTAATAQRYAALSATRRLAALRGLARSSTLVTLALSGLAALAVLAMSPFLLALFGEGFGAGTPALAVLLAGLVFQAAAGPGEDLLNVLGHERACAAVFLGSVVLCALLCIVLTAKFGMLGAASAVAVSTALRSLILSLIVRLKLDLNIFLPLRPDRGASILTME